MGGPFVEDSAWLGLLWLCKFFLMAVLSDFRSCACIVLQIILPHQRESGGDSVADERRW
jgi:hypothetical protein